MRYYRIDDIVFTDKDGVSKTIKDMRKIESFDEWLEIEKNENDFFDEIATRPDVYGNDAELLVYRIFDANITEIIDNVFDFTLIKRVKIPV